MEGYPQRHLFLPSGDVMSPASASTRARAALSLALAALALLVSAAAWWGFVHSAWGARLRGMNQIVFVGLQRAEGDAGSQTCTSVIIVTATSSQWNQSITASCAGTNTSRFTTDASDPAFSPQLYVMQPDGSGVRRLTNLSNGYYFSPAWSPDGAHIAAFSGTISGGAAAHLVVMDADGSNPRAIPAVTLRLGVFDQSLGVGFSPYSRLIAWSPDGRQLVAPVGIGQYVLVNVDGSRPRPFSGILPAWSPDGRYLAYYVSDGDTQHVARSFSSPAYTLELLDTRTFQTKRLGHLPALNAEALAWSPDGRYLAASAFQPGVYAGQPADGVLLVRADGSSPRVLAQWVNGDVRQVVWSPDSRKLAVVMRRFIAAQLDDAPPNDGSDLWVVNLDGSNAREIGLSDDGQPSWSPDGKRLVYASLDDSALLVADTSVQPRALIRSLSLSMASLSAPCWSPLAGI